ncbi:MAG: hypothetical protein WAN66_16360 [Limnoraphis robusta]|uniref:Uncharacterized protein n=1 Tax=Limnoraphis robusta CCNP1315 TaxID=3110306 RepID=A0ABU5U4X4_9CYAN|nr:hypothetical protein [Limnoraphis robusta]MCG5059603.1 hypothetical protein [Limnoraphis sp. WC205]MEA5497966.1 hypothetical protein [Limnoraphis robusta BA-68 BA1]MEA5522232.1 hypothetical protein [Limnoraphis robusta CCNP1315]MEA5543204.1 hypothetical protein [Limnoraphis robusta Tam1]MEA5549178.1 hypothetical protein [Limnoraphis robusta CCNP1324]
MEIIVIFLGIALYLIWSEEGKGKPPQKPKEEWQEVNRKRVTTIEEQPKPKS